MSFAVAQTKYVPLDELLDRPKVRILRTLQHFDWATPGEIAFAAGAESGTRDRTPERMGFDQALSRLTSLGQLERRGEPRDGQYRITAAGRAELRRMLLRSEVGK